MLRLELLGKGRLETEKGITCWVMLELKIESVARSSTPILSRDPVAKH